MRQKLLLLILILFGANVALAADLNSPVGYWKTIDEVSGKVRSIIKISEADNQTLSGKLVKTFPQAGESIKDTCKKCSDSDPRKNQLILGMTILTGLKKEGDEWKGGEILDPTNGKTYRCAIHTVDGGKKLNVRGYIGFELLGRTQIWERSDSAES
jgi:uncharacterized protein (DUF2147 family)